MRQPLTRLNLGSYGHCSCTNRCAPPDASTVPPSSKEDPSLAIEAWQRGYCAQTFARREIECDHFVLGYAVKPSIRPKSQAARLPESGPAIRGEDAYKATVSSIIFADGRRRILGSEWMFTANDHVSARCDSEVERAEIRIFDLPGGIEPPFRTQGQNSVIAFSVRVEPRREKEGVVLAERKTARKRDRHRRKHNLARPIEDRRKRHDCPR